MLLETWRGVEAMIADIYSARSLVAGNRDVQVLACANVENFERLLQDQSRPLELPVVGIMPSNIDPNDGSYNRNVMRRHGVALSVSENRDTWTIVRVAPYVMTLQVMMVTDDLVTAWRMVDRWLSHELWRFELKFSNYSAKIKLDPDKSIAFPQPAPSSGGANQFRIQTNLKAETYAGYVWQVPSVRTVELDLGIARQRTPGDASFRDMANSGRLAAWLDNPDHVIPVEARMIYKPPASE